MGIPIQPLLKNAVNKPFPSSLLRIRMEISHNGTGCHGASNTLSEVRNKAERENRHFTKRWYDFWWHFDPVTQYSLGFAVVDPWNIFSDKVLC